MYMKVLASAVTFVLMLAVAGCGKKAEVAAVDPVESVREEREEPEESAGADVEEPEEPDDVDMADMEEPEEPAGADMEEPEEAAGTLSGGLASDDALASRDGGRPDGYGKNEGA